MKAKRFLALLLTICMIGGLMPTVFAADAEEAVPIVYDFSTAALADYATPNKSVKYTLVNNYKINPEVSANWRYTGLINESNVAFQPDGMCFFTPAKNSGANSNAVILTLEIPTAGSYTPSIDYTEISYGEKVDVYLLKKDFVTANNVDIFSIGGVQAGIALASMTNPDADVKHIATYDTNPNATVEDTFAKSVNLTEGEYYLVAVANEGSVNYTAEERTYGMLNKLTFNPYVDESKKVWTYDFTASAFSNYSGSGNISSSYLKNYTLDRTKSTGYWKYENHINENYVAAAADGLYFYTPAKSAPLNSNSVIFTFTVEVDGAFVPSVEYPKVAYGEKTDLYLVKKDVANAKGWNVLTIEGVQSAIAAASMTNPDADVKYIASYDIHPNATVGDAYPEKINLTAGDYYLIAVANEGSINYAAEARTYGAVSKLLLTPYVAPVIPDNFSYNFTLGAYKPGTASTNVKLNLFSAASVIDRTVSTGLWWYCNMHNIPGAGAYAEGLQYYARKDIIDNNFVVLNAVVEKDGIYKTQLNFKQETYCGKINIHMISKEYADSKWKMTSDALVIADVLADSKAEKVISVDTHKNSTASSPATGETLELKKGDYYLIFTNEMGAKDTSDGRYYGYLSSLDFTRTYPLTDVEVSFDEIKIGDKLIPSVKYFSGDNELDGSSAAVSVEIADDPDRILLAAADGSLFAVKEGEATVRVSATIANVTKSVDVKITVLPASPLSGVDQSYLFYNNAYEDFDQSGLSIPGSSAGYLVKESEFTAYPMRDYGTDRPWGMVSGRLTRPNSQKVYLASNAEYTDISGYAGDWVAYKVKVPAPGTYNVDVRGLSYASAGRAEVYMLPYSSDMTFSSITNNIEKYCVVDNLVADADLYSTGNSVACRAYAGQFLADSSLDYSKGYAEYLMVIKQCNSRVNTSKYAVLLKGIYLVGTPRDIIVTTALSEDSIGVGEAVTVESVTGKFADGSTLNFDTAKFIHTVAEDDTDIIEYDAETGEIRALAEGVGTLKTCVIVNGTVSYTETEITVDDDFAIERAYIYTNNKVTLGEELIFTTGYELKNRKVLAGGELVSLEIFNESDEGVAMLSESGKTIRAIKAGSFEVKAKIKIRGTVVESAPEKILVFSEGVAPSSVLEINFMQGAYLGDNYSRINDIKTYTDFRPWIFHSIGNANTKYDVDFALPNRKYGQIGWLGGANLYNSYIAFKVKFPKTSTYLAEGNMGLCRARSAAFDLYIMPATEEIESNILQYAVPTSEYYVGTADYYSKPDDNDGFSRTFGTKAVTEGEHLVVYRISESGEAGAGGDSAYPLTFTFADEEAFGGVELVTESGSNVIALDETANTFIKLKTIKGAEIEYEEGDITAVVFKSENPEIANVDPNGAITGISEGSAKIIATVTYGGITKKAEYIVSVSDNSGIVENGIRITAPASVYVYGASKLGVTAEMNSGKTLAIPEEFITWELVEGSEYAELSENGNVYGIGIGTAVVSATVSADYKNGAAEGIAIEPLALEISWDATVDPQIYTLEERENAKINAKRYSWAKDEVKAVKEAADKYVNEIDYLYNLIVPEGLPRWYHIGHTGDPDKFLCRYCGDDISVKYGAYGWGVNAMSDPWKVQCPTCKRLFPSNDFGSFYELGLSESGSWSYEKALMNHHKLFVCADGENCNCKNIPHPTNDRMTEEWKSFYGFGIGYLENKAYKEMDAKLGVVGWGVDDSLGYMQPYISYEKALEIVGPDGDVRKVPGYSPLYYDNGDGLAWYADGARKGPVQHTYISYYIHEGLWYGQGNVANSAVIRNAINSLAKAFVYTGEAKYGRAGAILLDRIADFFPDLVWRTWGEWRGDSYYGGIVDAVWQTFITTEFAEAYDAFLPIYNDPYVIKYLSENGARYETDENGDWKRDENGALIPINLKDTPGAARKNIEDNLLLEIFKQTKLGMNWGNYGMHQNAVATAAVALNRLPETKEMIDWVMAYGPKYGTSGLNSGSGVNVQPISGGMFLGTIIENVSRDGIGSESAPGYNATWISNFLGVAETLRGYELYPSADLYENARFTKMFAAQARLTLGGYYTTQTGDSGALASTGLALYTEETIKGYKATKDPLLAQVLWLIHETYGDEIRGSILDEDPEQITKDVEAVIDEIGELNLASDMLTGYGFAALRAGGEYESASPQTYKNTHRDFAIYFGKNSGHGHADTLNLFMDAYGLNLAPEIGYPEVTGAQPNRMEWVRTTLSHNTVVVDEKEQQSTTVQQNPHHFDDAGRVKVMDVSADVYSNVDEYRRTIFMVDANDDISYGVDFFHIKGGKDHLYSFHSQTDTLTAISGLSDVEVTPMYTDEEGNLYGTYAGADVKFGADPGGVNSGIYPRGYTWLKNVRTYNSIDTNFTVEFDVKDWKRILNEKRDIRLRLTMLSDKPYSEVTFATAVPPQTKSNAHATDFDYLLVRNKGTNLDTTFTTVYEPYDASEKYIESIEKVSMVRDPSSKPGLSDSYSAVKVTLINGRIDYVMYSTNNAVDYVIDDNICFRGFGGVLSLDADGNIIYSYLNDGEVLKFKDSDVEDSVAAYTGIVKSFTEELTTENYIRFSPDAGQNIDIGALANKFVYIDNDGVENGVYKIIDAYEDNGEIVLDIGDVSAIRNYVDAKNISLGYTYNIEKGQELRIPITSVVDTAPTLECPEDATVSVGSTITIPIYAESPVGRDIEIIGTRIPRGASIDSERGVLTWKPSDSQSGENHLEITASDGISETTVHFYITVYGKTTGAGSSTGESTGTGSEAGSSTGVGTGSAGGSSGGAGGGGSAGSSGSGATAPSDDKKPTETPDTGKEETTGSKGETSSARFIDLGAHAWAADSINDLASSGIIKGTSETTFSPAANITRADFALLLVRAFKLESENT
ncbi:MAG: heparinase II/III family protein, partial [Oscillospiraceae bacterium]|nr:heparinase II/III family protein [Oscillospiraceae bacterium]